MLPKSFRMQKMQLETAVRRSSVRRARARRRRRRAFVGVAVRGSTQSHASGFARYLHLGACELFACSASISRVMYRRAMCVVRGVTSLLLITACLLCCGEFSSPLFNSSFRAFFFSFFSSPALFRSLNKLPCIVFFLHFFFLVELKGEK